MSPVSSAAVLPLSSSVRAERSLSAIRRVDRRLNFIRTLCHLRPSAEVWAKVCEGFETWSSRDAGFEFWVSMASQQLERWPDALRALPPRWVWTLLCGDPCPPWILKLARGLSIQDPGNLLSPDTCWPKRLAQSAAADADTMRWLHMTGASGLCVDALAEVLGAGRWQSLRHLSLDGAALSPPACAALALWMSHNSTVEALDLNNVSLDGAGLQHLLHNARLSRLQHLNLRDNHLNDAAITALCDVLRAPEGAALPAMWLDLSGNPIGNQGLAALQRLSNTRPYLRVYIGAGCLDAKGIKRWLSLGWRRPEKLDLSKQMGAGDGLPTLLTNPSLSQTRSLDLSATSTRGLTLRQCLHTPWVINNLEHLALRSNGLNAGTLWPTSTLSALRSLDLSCNPLRRGGITALARWSLPKLQTLDLSRTQLCDDSAQALSESPWFHGIKRLNASFNRLGPSGVLSLLSPCYKLEHLDLRNNPLGNAGVLSLVSACAASQTLRSLRSLDLSRCDADAEAVFSLLEQPNALTHLTLHGLPLTPPSILRLASSPFLPHLLRIDADWHALTPTSVLPLTLSPWINDTLRAFLRALPTTAEAPPSAPA